MKLKPLLNGILFIFHDKITNGKFDEMYGVIYRGVDQDETIRKPRWGKVVSIGPDVEDVAITPGSDILIEPMAWTRGLEYDDIKVWKTDESRILGVRE